MTKYHSLFVNSGLSLDRLRVLESVVSADCKHIKAAENYEGRAAQFSRQIRELSEFFGANLLAKKGNTQRLTPEGAELVGIIREAFQRLTDFKAQCSKLPKHFSIAAGDSLLHWLVIPRIAALGKSIGDYSFSLHNLQNAEIVHGLQDLSLDFGLIRTTEAKLPLHRLILGTKTYALIIPQALASSDQIAGVSAEVLLQKLPLAGQAQDTHFQRKFEKWAYASKIQLSIGLYCESVPEVVRALCTGRYAAVLHSLASRELDPAKFHRVDLPTLDDLAPQIALAWNPGLLKIRGKAAETIKDLLSKALRFSGNGSVPPPSKIPVKKK